jgi:riboflavin kinase/FMN adenylyltransferase
MEIYQRIDAIKDRPAVVLAIGAFDGVHRGHRAIIARVCEEARRRGVKSMLMTFSPTPREILGSEKEIALMKADEKIAMIRDLNVDMLCIRAFNRHFSGMSREAFMARLLKYLDLKALVAGPDHHIGKRHEGGIAFLQNYALEHAFDLLIVPKSSDAGGEISSQRIPQALKQGRIEDVNAMLGYSYRISGTVIPGKKRGRKLGYPTLNVKPHLERCLIPACGVYCVRLTLDGREYPAVCNIGTRPTFAENGISLEVHAIGVQLEQQYGKTLEIHFEHYVREERKFDKEADLISRIGKDIETCKTYLTEEKCQV